MQLQYMYAVSTDLPLNGRNNRVPVVNTLLLSLISLTCMHNKNFFLAASPFMVLRVYRRKEKKEGGKREGVVEATSSDCISQARTRTEAHMHVGLCDEWKNLDYPFI